MTVRRIGVDFSGPVRQLEDTGPILARIKLAEEMGISAAWLITVGAHLDGVTVFAAAAAQTQRILMGSSITPTFPRHPVAVAQQLQVLEQIAPGRFRMGVGPSRRQGVEGIFGMEYKAPLGHLREYLRILKALIQQGSVDFEGRYYRAHAKIRAPVDMPIMGSALMPKSFELCGAESDGAITWLLPGTYLRDVAVPGLKAGAEAAGRPVPPLVAHVPVCVHDNASEVVEGVQAFFGTYFFPEFQKLFTTAGLPEGTDGRWGQPMVDAVVPWGDEMRVAERLKEIFSFGVSEIIVSPVPAGADSDASRERTLRLLAQVSRDFERE